MKRALGGSALLLALAGSPLLAGSCQVEEPASAGLPDGGPMDASMDSSVGGMAGIGGTLVDAGLMDVTLVDSGNTGGEPGDAETDASTCVEINQAARVVERPVDIIFLVDNSESMSGEISQVRARINQDFAGIIEASGIDYRVIMFSRYGAGTYDVCVAAPLGPDDCSAPDPTQILHNPPRFYHYNTRVYSTDSLCLLLSRWTQPDDQGNAPWSEHLRVGAHKTFVEITDDGVACGQFPSDRTGDPTISDANARAFDSQLRMLSRDHFGVTLQRTYSWFSIVGMPDNDPVTEPWGPTAEVQTGICAGAAAAGTTYQVLSNATGALRWPVCRNDDFSAMFRAVATSVVQKASISCSWSLPAPPEDKTYDADQLSLILSEPGASEQALPRVDAAGDCGDGWYVDDNLRPRTVSLCPDTCLMVRDSDDAKLNINVPCESIVDPVE